MENLEITKGFPWMAKGRWYRFFTESDGANYKLTQSDLEGTEITSNYLKLPSGYHVIDVKGDVHSIDEGTASNAMIPRYFADDCQGVTLPNKNSFDSAYIYVFGYKH